MNPRRTTRQLHIGPVTLGGNALISVQSMCTTDPTDAQATLKQIHALHRAGCDLVRVALPNRKALAPLKDIVQASPIPVIADIHFQADFALAALRAGVHGLRLNPGNLDLPTRLAEIVDAARPKRIPIRIGINGGSLEPELLRKHGGATAAAMVESALSHVRLLEELRYPYVKVSLKSSDPALTLAANREFAALCDVPLHLGLTEAGTALSGTARGVAVLSTLLAEGLGDTVRLSLSADPVTEVRVASEMLAALGLRAPRLRVVACPTCGRTQYPKLYGLAEQVEEALADVAEPWVVAVMGCVVNGPGEAKGADVALVLAEHHGDLYIQGHFSRRVEEEDFLPALTESIASLREAQG